MSKVNGQSVAAQRRACGRDPPKEKKEKNVSRETWACGLLPVDYTCGLWCVLVGGTHPYFLFLLEGWWNTTSPLFRWGKPKAQPLRVSYIPLCFHGNTEIFFNACHN